MGGYDLYSNSKGCSELVTLAYRRSFLQHCGIALGSARAGNVIGGGDWAADRLVSDILRAFERGEPVVIRNPTATRPWQHVLEPLSGYMALAEQHFQHGQVFAEAWNFGPRDEDARPVGWIVKKMADLWSQYASWHADEATQLHEANELKLDISKAKQRLNWAPRWSLEFALQSIVEWHYVWLNHNSAYHQALQQIERYMKDKQP